MENQYFDLAFNPILQIYDVARSFFLCSYWIYMYLSTNSFQNFHYS